MKRAGHPNLIPHMNPEGPVNPALYNNAQRNANVHGHPDITGLLGDLNNPTGKYIAILRTSGAVRHEHHRFGVDGNRNRCPVRRPNGNDQIRIHEAIASIPVNKHLSGENIFIYRRAYTAFKQKNSLFDQFGRLDQVMGGEDDGDTAIRVKIAI